MARRGPATATDAVSRAGSSATSSASSAIPSPRDEETATTGEPASDVRANSRSTSATTAAARAGSTRSTFVTAAKPDLDPERVEQLEVLERLRPRPVVGCHDEERGVDLAGPDEHVADQPVVSRDVDEVDLAPVRQPQMGIPDVDRHPPPSFLGQPIGVDPGQGAEERRLAVVDVAGRPDDDGHPGCGGSEPVGTTPASAPA